MTTITLEQAFLFNPRVQLAKGTVAPFVTMATLKPFTRDVQAAGFKPYSGGAKFLDGDVLMARITPSLENGKTSIYRAAPGSQAESAFGSTEFIVIRGREGVSDSTFAYYVFTSVGVRDHAISSMNGSSGRQRVQNDALGSYEIDLPSLPEQRNIAATLGALDDRIGSLSRQRALLRELGLSHYAAAVRAQGSHAAPLSRMCASISRGVTPKYVTDDDTAPLVLNQKCIRDGWVSTELARRMHERQVAPAKIATAGDILVNSTGTGTVGRVGRWRGEPILVDSHVSVVRPDAGAAPSTVLAYALLGREQEISELATGSTGQTELSPERLGSLIVHLPPDEYTRDLETTLVAFESQIGHIEGEIDTLVQLRDALGPELLAGRVHATKDGGE